MGFLWSRNRAKGKKTNPTETEYSGMGQAQTESGTASRKTTLNPKEIHTESLEQRHDPSFMACSSSPPRADVPCQSGSFFPMVKTPTDQGKQLLGASSAPFQPKTRAQPCPCPWFLAVDVPADTIRASEMPQNRLLTNTAPVNPSAGRCKGSR